MILYKISFVTKVERSVVVEAQTPDEAVEKTIDWLHIEDVTPAGYFHLEVIARSK